MKKEKVEQLLCLLTCLLLVVGVSVRRNGKLAGHDFAEKTKATADYGDTVKVAADGTAVVNTAPLAGDIDGYGGPVPLYVYVKDGKVVKIVAQDNSETPEFFERASALFGRWTGKSVGEAMAEKVDGVSGATFSSRAIIGNVRRGLAYVSSKKDMAEPSSDGMSAKDVAAVVVVLLGLSVPLALRGRKWHYALAVLDVAVLGLWCGTFISFDSLMGLVSNGPSLPSGIAILLMAVAAFVYPLFGKKNYYCNNVCPFGALQDLAGKCSKRKLRMSAGLAKALGQLRTVLFGVLVLLMLLGVFPDWTGYELFTAFVFETASVWVIVAAVVVALLAVFVPRPYCRFVCPTGTLLKLSQNTK